MAVNISITPEAAALTIGDDYAEENSIRFKINLTGDGPVWLTMQVPVGEDGVLRQPEDANDMVVATPEYSDQAPNVISKDEDAKIWSLGDYDNGVQVSGSTQLLVEISNILCRANEGSCSITIIGETETEDVEAEVLIEKSKPTAELANPILYFIAEPASLIGRGDVTLAWDVKPSTSVSLTLSNGARVSPVTSPQTDSITDSNTYTLAVEGTTSQSRQFTVNVLTSGWHELYPLGRSAFPSVIFDSVGGNGGSLYAIFVRGPERNSVLCRSANGLTGWEVIDTNVPDGMESSPGVLLGNRLWLIGGSAVDPDQISNRICYYDLADPNEGWRNASVTGFDDGARMGHACVVVDDTTLWVLGGLDKYHTCLNDVWSLTINADPNKRGDVEAQPLPKTAGWDPRCMFSAVNFNDTIWLLGGVSSPNGNPLGDLWKTRDRTDWEAVTGPDGMANAIGTGTATEGDKLFSVFTTRELKGGGWNLRTRMSKLMGETTTGSTWSELGSDSLQNSVEKWTNWTSTPHSTAMVGFDARLYLRCLHRNAFYGDDFVGAPLHVYVMST